MRTLQLQAQGVGTILFSLSGPPSLEGSPRLYVDAPRPRCPYARFSGARKKFFQKRAMRAAAWLCRLITGQHSSHRSPRGTHVAVLMAHALHARLRWIFDKDLKLSVGALLIAKEAKENFVQTRGASNEAIARDVVS